MPFNLLFQPSEEHETRMLSPTRSGISSGLPPTREDKPTTPDMDQKTRVVDSINGEKTILVPGLQQKRRKAYLQIYFKGMDFGNIGLPDSGFFNLGRRSSDSTASIKLTPDMSMSRVHAGMRTVKTPAGQIVYQITPAKEKNPVFVNGAAVGKGKAFNLKNGDKIRMGETDIIFKLK